MRLTGKHLILGAVAIAAAVAIVVYGTGKPPPPTLKKVALQLAWTHSATNAGFYSAAQNGDYAAHGLDVSFLTGGPKIDPVDSVVAGTAQFGLANGGQRVKARASGKPVKAVACIYRRSPLVYITLASSGITHPRQFAGKLVRVSTQNLVTLHAMASRSGVDPTQIRTTKTRDLKRFYSG